VCAIGAATAAHAQPPDQVSIELQGVPPGVPVEIFMSGARADQTIAGASASIASSFMSDGKPVDIVIDRCQDRTSVSIIEDADGRMRPADPACGDRTIIENVPWVGGRRLVIDVVRGVVVRNPTIGTRPEVQSAARAVLDALRGEPAAGVATGATTAAVIALATISDGALSTWVPSFRDSFAAMGRQGASNTTLAAMEQLLNVMGPQFALPSGANPPVASAAPTSANAAREFRFSVDYVRPSPLGQRGTQSALTTASPSVTLSGRFLTPGAPIGRDRQWYYSFATGRSIGLSNGTGGEDSAVVADDEWDDWIEVREPTSVTSLLRPASDRRNRFFARSRSSAAIADLASLVSGILPNFIERGLRFGGPVTTPRVTAPLSGSRVQQTDQGQASLATPSPASNQQGSTARPPRLLLAARSFAETLLESFVPTPRSAAFSAPGVRLVIGPRGRREYWIDPMQSIAAAAQTGTDVPRPSLKVFIRSLGRSTGDNAQEAIIINDGNVPVRVLESEAFATEPLEGVSEQAIAKEMEKYAGRPRMTMTLTSYCLNYEKAAPTKGRVYRVAARAAQDQLEPVRRILSAAELVRDAGELHPDGDPNLYFHSVRQWAIWTVEKGFNERRFADELLEYTKKNVAASGRRWTKEIDAAARSIIPNRWQDVQRVLAAAQQGI
jgi:hypothetical protein